MALGEFFCVEMKVAPWNNEAITEPVRCVHQNAMRRDQANLLESTVMERIEHGVRERSQPVALPLSYVHHEAEARCSVL